MLWSYGEKDLVLPPHGKGTWVVFLLGLYLIFGQNSLFGPCGAIHKTLNPDRNLHHTAIWLSILPRNQSPILAYS